VSDDYLWDRSGPAEPDVARLERILGTLRFTPDAVSAPPLDRPSAAGTGATTAASSTFGAAPVADTVSAPVTSWPSARPSLVPARRSSVSRFVLPFSIAATLLIAAGSFWLTPRAPRPAAAWQVTRLDGAPIVNDRRLTGEAGSLPVGRWLETDATARARITIAHVGRVDVDPGTRVGLLDTSPGRHKLYLERGTIHAHISASPGAFFVLSKAATMVDLGCAYTMRIAENGDGFVRVSSGWVGVDGGGRASIVPSGAMSPMWAATGAGTPYFEDAPDALRTALAVFDRFTTASPDRDAALASALAASRGGDALTLWHLLTRADEANRDRVFERLASFVPPPDGVTREGIRAGDEEMRARWWDALRLGGSALWRTWSVTTSAALPGSALPGAAQPRAVLPGAAPPGATLPGATPLPAPPR